MGPRRRTTANWTSSARISKLAEVDPRLPPHLHVQAVCKVTYERSGKAGHQVGRAVLEQLVIGPHAPSGFKEMLDFAP